MSDRVVLTDARAARSGPRYALVRKLGAGAMGEVHVASDADLGREVALKRMDPAIARDDGLARRFSDEVQITAQLDHPGIIPVYSLERAKDGTLSYAMKLVRGKTLDDVLAETRAFYDAGRAPDDEHALAARLELFLQICAPIHYAHTRGVIHRDLKPENVMVGAFHEVIVMDWGIARLIGGTEPVSEQELGDGASRTQFGLVIGTPSYMSPEQAMGNNDDLDGRSDQYALGLILYELVSLRRAVVGKTAYATVVRAQEAEKDPLVPYSAKEAVHPALRAIVGKATAPEPDRRYADVEALADDVRRFLRDEAVLARPDGLSDRAKRWVGRNRGTALAAVLGLLLLLVGVGGLAVVGGLVAVQAQQYAARVREERLGEVLAVASTQAHRMDTRFQRYEALLSGLAFAAEGALARDPEPRRIWLAEQFAAGNGPPDVEPSKVHGGKVSLGHPDLKVATGAQVDERRLLQLASLQPHLFRAIVRSQSEDLVTRPFAQQKKLVFERGVPVVWAYAALEEGVLVGLPGAGDYPDPYDPRGRPWYVAAKEKKGPRWGAAYVDPNGAGIVVPVSQGIFDASGTFQGIVALDISITHIVDELLDPPDLEVEAWLVDREGKVVVRSSLKDAARTAKDYDPEPFPHVEVEAAMRAEPTGHAEIGGELFVWRPLEAMPWTYVVSGDASTLIGAW